MNGAALIDQIQQARETLEKLLTSLQSAPVERDQFVAHSIRPAESIVERAKPPQNPASASFRIAESMGFKGEFRQWRPSCGSGIDPERFQISRWETCVACSQSSDGSGGLALLTGLAVLGSDQTVLKQALNAIRRLRN
jgi:hypothetical protein